MTITAKAQRTSSSYVTIVVVAARIVRNNSKHNKAMQLNLNCLYYD